MRRVIVPLVAGLVLASFMETPRAHATTTATSPGSSFYALRPPKSSSEWLRAGEARQERQEFPEAGEAYRHALEALSPEKQRANEGARAAMLAAEAYYRAFEQDASVAHLQAGLQILERWLQKADLANKATLHKSIERMASQMLEVHDHLQQGDTALGADDVGGASEHYGKALSALAAQRRAWSSGARVAVRIAGAQVSAYDGRIVSADDIEPNRPLLVEAKGTLEGWKGRRPSGEAPAQAEAIDALLSEIQARLDDADQQLAQIAVAEQERKAQRLAQERRLQAEQAEQARQQQAQLAEEASDRKGQRTLSIVLLSVGAVATGAGAGLLGEGLAFRGRSGELTDEANAEANALEQTSDGFSRDQFDSDLRDFEDRSARRNLGLIAGGGVLLAGGLATAITGTVMLVRLRKQGSDARERARLMPSISPRAALLSLRGRF